MNRQIHVVNFRSSYDIEDNFLRMKKIINSLGESKSDMIVFPECSLQGYMPFAEKKSVKFFAENAIAISRKNKYIKVFASYSKKYGTSICLGLIEKDPEQSFRLFDTALLINPNGYIYSYRKAHLATNEPYFFHSGDELKIFESKIGKVGIVICYDICFPEAARTLALKGAETIIVISAWGFTDMGCLSSKEDLSCEIFDLYARTRAVENQVLLIVSNQTGLTRDKRLDFVGRSKIISPSGKIIARLGYEEKTLSVKVDIEKEIKNERLYNLSALNLLKNRRPEIYQS